MFSRRSLFSLFAAVPLAGYVFRPEDNSAADLRAGKLTLSDRATKEIAHPVFPYRATLEQMEANPNVIEMEYAYRRGGGGFTCRAVFRNGVTLESTDCETWYEMRVGHPERFA